MSEDDQTSILKVLVQLRDEVTDPLKQVNDRFGEMAENFASIGMAAGEVFAGYEAISQVIEPAAAMQEQMVGLKEATLANAEALEQYKRQADEIGSSMPLTGGAEEALQAMTELYKTFRDDGALKEQTETAAKLAVVMGDTAPLAAKVLSSAVQNLGDTSRPVIDQMKEFGDEIAILQARFPMGSGGLMRMSMALRMLGTAAQVNNVAQKTMLALMAEGNRINLGGPRGSGPILAGIVNSLLKMKDGRYEMEKYGLQVVKTTDGHVNLIKTLDKMSQMSDRQKRALESSMGSQGANVALLIKHMDDLKEAYNEIDHAQGQLDQDAKDREETFNAQMSDLKNAWQEAKESLGKHLLPDLTDDLKSLRSITDVLNKFSENHPNATGVVANGLEWGAALAAIFGGMKLIQVAWGWFATAPGLATALEMLQGTWAVTVALFTGGIEDIGLAFGLLFESNPIGWIITGVAAIAIGSYEIYKHWEDIKDAIEGAASAVSSFFHVATFKDWGRILGDVAGGNFGAAGFDFGMTAARGASTLSTSDNSTSAPLTYAPVVHVHVGAGADGDQIGNAVVGSLDNHWETLAQQLADQRHQDARRSFGNPALEGAR